MKLLITGVAGAIGSILADVLINQGHKVTGIDNLSSGNLKNINPKINFIKRDIREISSKTLNNIDVVFHLAALTKLTPSIIHPIDYHDVNVNGTINLLGLARLNRVKRVVFASSGAVYGHRKNVVEEETMMPMPINPYSTTKLIGEEYMKCWSKCFNLDTVSLRFFNVYGARENYNSEYICLIAKFFKQKKRGNPLTICGNGEQRYDFIDVRDVVDAIIKAGLSTKPMCGESINIGTGKNYSINEISKMIGGEIKFIPNREGDVNWSLANNYKAFKYLNWKPKYKLEDYIKRIKNDLGE